MSDLAHDPDLGNHDLNPTSLEDRTWTWVDFAALWIGMAHNIPTWLMAGSLIALGLNWWQATLTIAVGNLIVLVPIILNSHPGTKYGIPFPVIARASLGVRGANLATLVRGLVAAVWFGIQVHVGAQALKLILTRLTPGIDGLNASPVLGQGILDWMCYLVFLLANLWILRHGMHALRRFERWAAPAILVLAFLLWVWAWRSAGSHGPILSASGKTPDTTLFIKSLMSVIGFWATLSLNASDFTRFARSQRDQIIGQTLGMPTTMVVFSLLGVLTTSATAVLFGKVIWDVVELIQRLPSPLMAVVCLFGVVIATLSVNVPANLVSAAYDMANLAPRHISLWRGACLAALLGTLVMPWRLLANAQTYIFDWLATSAIALAPVAGILIADYWLVRRCELAVPELYRADGRYFYWKGVNPRGVAALALGLAVAYSGYVVPGLRLLSDMGWLTGLFVALISYRLLMGRQTQSVSL